MKFTEIGYFGRPTNVTDAPISDAATGAVLASLASLPRRATPPAPSAAIIPFPIARGPQGEPLRFIAVDTAKAAK